MKEIRFFNVNEAEQFVFYRIPKVLMTDPEYKKISAAAKLLYGLLLDRVGLSIENNWVDGEGKVYIIFSRENAAELMGCGKDKIIKLFKELKKFNLIEEKAQGLNEPKKIYLANLEKNDYNSAND